MKALLSMLRELWSLFVDDGILALALVLWCAIAGLILPRLPPVGEWSGAIFFVGCLAILLIDIVMAIPRHRKR